MEHASLLQVLKGGRPRPHWGFNDKSSKVLTFDTLSNKDIQFVNVYDR